MLIDPDQLTPDDLTHRVAELKQLGDNWLDGQQGHALDNAKLTRRRHWMHERRVHLSVAAVDEAV